jgi:hypothetical protein
MPEERAERMDWIKATLQDPNAELYVGCDREKKRYDWPGHNFSFG